MNGADGMAQPALNAAVSRVDRPRWLTKCLVDPDGRIEVNEDPLEVLGLPEQRQILRSQAAVVCVIEQGSVLERWPDVDAETVAAQQCSF
jgi:hypothetical protein